MRDETWGPGGGYPGTTSDDVTTGDGFNWGTGAMRDEDGAEGGMTGKCDERVSKEGEDLLTNQRV